MHVNFNVSIHKADCAICRCEFEVQNMNKAKHIDEQSIVIHLMQKNLSNFSVNHLKIQIQLFFLKFYMPHQLWNVLTMYLQIRTWIIILKIDYHLHSKSFRTYNDPKDLHSKWSKSKLKPDLPFSLPPKPLD